MYQLSCESQGARTDLYEQVFSPQSVSAECSNWYAVYTRSRHEKVVHNFLGEKGLSSFLPLRNVLSQWKDRRKCVQKPLFPGYLFVQVRQEELYLVTTTPGVAYILGGDTEPVPVPDEQLQAVRSLVESPYPVVPWPLLRKGRRVRITAGPLSGIETYIIQRKGREKCRLVVTVDILGRSVAVEVDPRCVEPVP
jgi:transcription antitermination factor NusG